MTNEIREIIQTLSRYATEIPKDRPPELLPWELDDRWGLDGAAGQAVGGAQKRVAVAMQRRRDAQLEQWVKTLV